MLKRAAADRLVVATSFVVVLLAATLVAAIPIYANAVAESGLRGRLARAPATEGNLQATVHLFNGGRDAGLDRRVSAIVRDVFSATGVSIFRSRESEPFSVQGRDVVFGSFDRISEHARIVAGGWPGPGQTSVEVAVPDAVARALRVDVGQELRARDRLDGRQVVARVVGIYKPTRPVSAYWWGNPLAIGADGPLITTRETFFGLGLQDAELRWRLQPHTQRLTIARAVGLRHKLALLPQRLNSGRPSGQEFAIDTNLPAILAGAERSLHLARAGVLVPSIQLALLAIYGLIFTASLLTERRSRATEVMRLRGATTSQIAWGALSEAALIALPAVIAAPWLAAASLHALNHVGPLAAIDLRLEPRPNLSAYALSVLAGAICVAALVLPALRAGRLALAVQRLRLPLAGLAQRSRLDLALAALALLGYWQLRRYHSVLVGHRGSLGIDPFLVVAPALLLLAGALLTLRLVPAVARVVERSLTSARGTVPALGFWQLARRPRGYSRSVLLLVLAVAIGVFAAAYAHTWHRSEVDQASFVAGADLNVEPSDVGGAPPTIDLDSAYRGLGVAESLPAASDSFELGTTRAESGNLLALDARRAAAVIHPRGDFASRPFAKLMQPLSSDRHSLGSLSLPGKPSRLALTARLTMSARKRIGFVGRDYRDQPGLFLTLRDGEGLLYLYRLRGLAPGRTRRFVLDLTHRLPSGHVARPRYPLALVALELDLDVPYLAPRTARFVLRSFEVSEPGGPWRKVSLAGGRRWQTRVLGFKFAYEAPHVTKVDVAGGAVRATMTTGSAPDTFSRRSSQFFLRPGSDSAPTALPVLASDSLLAATDARVGEVIPLALTGGTNPVRIVGAFHRFPTLDPSAPTVLADLSDYLAVTFAGDGNVVQPSTWFLKTPGHDEEIAAALRAAPFRSLGVVSRREREHALLNDPIALGIIAALALGFVVAAAFAVVGFAAGATAAARARVLEFAVLRALGLRTGQISGWLSLESGLVLTLSLSCGTALGALVSWLVLPYVALGTAGTAPVPPVRVAVPWTTVAALELALLGALAVFAALQVLLVRRLRLAPALRGGEEVLAR